MASGVPAVAELDGEAGGQLMAEPVPAAKSSPKGILNGKWHGIPTPVLIVGGSVGAFLLYRWYSNRNASAASTTAPATSASNPYGWLTGDQGSGSTGGGGSSSLLPVTTTSTPSSTFPATNPGGPLAPATGPAQGASSNAIPAASYSPGAVISQLTNEGYTVGNAVTDTVQTKAIPLAVPPGNEVVTGQGPAGPTITVQATNPQPSVPAQSASTNQAVANYLAALAAAKK